MGCRVDSRRRRADPDRTRIHFLDPRRRFRRRCEGSPCAGRTGLAESAVAASCGRCRCAATAVRFGHLCDRHRRIAVWCCVAFRARRTYRMRTGLSSRVGLSKPAAHRYLCRDDLAVTARGRRDGAGFDHVGVPQLIRMTAAAAAMILAGGLIAAVPAAAAGARTSRASVAWSRTVLPHARDAQCTRLACRTPCCGAQRPEQGRPTTGATRPSPRRRSFRHLVAPRSCCWSCRPCPSTSSPGTTASRRAPSTP